MEQNCQMEQSTMCGRENEKDQQCKVRVCVSVEFVQIDECFIKTHIVDATCTPVHQVLGDE